MEEQRFVKNRVSIVTPVFNGESHLPHMLDSVLNQTYKNIEMILVDDGSTDQTFLVANSYQKKFAENGYGYQIIKAEHKNASAAINRGLPYVTGEFLIWPDSDDILEPDSIKRRVEFLHMHPQYQCVRTLAYYFDARSGKKIRADEKTGDLSREDLFWDILEGKTFVCCGCYMLRTEAFLAIYPSYRIPEYEVGQNFQMLLPFMYLYKCPTIKEKLYGVCVRQGSHSRRNLSQKEEKKKYSDYEDLVDEIAEICDLKDTASLKRIAEWKIRRKYQLALNYGEMRQAISAGKELCKYRKAYVWHIAKDVLHLGFFFSLEELKNLERKWYNKRNLFRLKNKNFTIIASNCNGTFMYYDLGLPFLSPTINLTIGMNDFVKMVENLEWYMEQEIIEEKGEYSCPQGLLGDIKIHFVHYASFEEGKQKWDERKGRINWDNIFIVGAEKGDCTYETLERFEQLPYKNKVILTHIEYPEFRSAYYIKGFENQKELGTTTNYKKQFLKRRYLDDFDYVKFLNSSYEEGMR